MGEPVASFLQRICIVRRVDWETSAHLTVPGLPVVAVVEVTLVVGFEGSGSGATAGASGPGFNELVGSGATTEERVSTLYWNESRSSLGQEN